MAISDETYGLIPDPAAGTIVATGIRSHPFYDQASFAHADGRMRDGVARIGAGRRAAEGFSPCRGQGCGQVPGIRAARVAPEPSGAALR